MDEIKLSPEFELTTLHHLHLPVTSISEYFTLYDLFRVIRNIEDTLPGLAAIFGMPRFDLFWKQIELDDNREDGDIEYLELYWHVYYSINVVPMTPEEQEKWTKDHNYNSAVSGCDDNYWENFKRAEISNLMSLHGIGNRSEEDIKRWPEYADTKCGYAIDFSPINNLKNLPLRLKPEVSFWTPFVADGEEPSRTGFVLEQYPTLYTLITSVFWELTFHGFDPKDVADKFEELKDGCEEARDIMGKVDNMDEEEAERYLDSLEDGEEWKHNG